MAYKVTIIGGGPGGYVAAIRCAQLGAEVSLVNNDILGGTCLNRGCIPTKALLHATEFLNLQAEANKCGVELGDVTYDLVKMMKSKDLVVKKMTHGVDYLMKRNRIKIIFGHGKLVNNKTVEVTNCKGSETLVSDAIILAPGSKPAVIPVPGHDLPGVINSTDALEMKRVPASIVVAGGGAVGVEFSSIYKSLGAEVTIVEMMPHILPNMDGEVVALLEKMLLKRGIKIRKSVGLESIEKFSDGLRIHVRTKTGIETIIAEQLLIAIGRVPNTANMGLEEAGIKLEKNHIVVNERTETSLQGVYAIGDAASRIKLAHAASHQGLVAAENCMGGNSVVDCKIVPSCIYTIPEVASVGLTENQAILEGYEVKIGRFQFAASGKAVAIGAPEGMVKIICDKKYHEILGVHIIGNRATEVIAEAVIAIKHEATAESLASVILAHPTISEAIAEAARDIYGGAIHS